MKSNSIHIKDIKGILHISIRTSSLLLYHPIPRADKTEINNNVRVDRLIRDVTWTIEKRVCESWAAHKSTTVNNFQHFISAFWTKGERRTRKGRMGKLKRDKICHHKSNINAMMMMIRNGIKYLLIPQPKWKATNLALKLRSESHRKCKQNMDFLRALAGTTNKMREWIGWSSSCSASALQFVQVCLEISPSCLLTWKSARVLLEGGDVGDDEW